MLWNRHIIDYYNNCFYLIDLEELGCFIDPLTPEIIFNIIEEEIQ